ncbi:hypothetical protein NW762_007591 [Fusarium torreyae]|uniref:RRM domain-containing protein n=1 Tax=Fusarium torreyae TaxID=1237075 RepID=A0A9W8RXB5_9HYPO|nr:hypothetical protein NW762_007591 [Fusarium torreyae]
MSEVAGEKRPREVEQDQNERGFAFHIWDFGPDTQKEDVEDLLRAKELPGEVYWPDTEPDNSHKGWCWLRFDLKDEAESARSKLSRATLQGGCIKTGLVTANLKRVRPRVAKLRIQDSLEIPQPSATEQPNVSDEFRTSSYFLPPVSTLSKHSARSAAIGSSEDYVPLRYPSTWKYNESDPDKYRREFVAAMAVTEANYERLGVKNRPMVIHHPGGHQILRSHLANNSVTGETFIYIRNPDGAREFKEIALQQLPVAELLG